MIDFAQVQNVGVTGVDTNAGTVEVAFDLTIHHAGVVANLGHNVTHVSFDPTGGIAAMEAAIASKTRALFLAQFGSALGANSILSDASKLL